MQLAWQMDTAKCSSSIRNEVAVQYLHPFRSVSPSLSCAQHIPAPQETPEAHVDRGRRVPDHPAEEVLV